jgi:hypothetical protein
VGGRGRRLLGSLGGGRQRQRPPRGPCLRRRRRLGGPSSAPRDGLELLGACAQRARVLVALPAPRARGWSLTWPSVAAPSWRCGLSLVVLLSSSVGVSVAGGAGCIRHGCSSPPPIVVPTCVRSVVWWWVPGASSWGCWRKPMLVRGLMTVTLSGAAHLVEGVIRAPLFLSLGCDHHLSAVG